ncbi:hypothetical protein L3V43_18585 [Pseudoalteromonas sp. L23]|nr:MULTISPECIES: hypothetical protein [unclassified Pseudoalteromonas]MCF7515683.1 hypothetical protein [Pseudoalteromonas sp. L7]MCF7527660.1 hypothetical protein [Pseudoalteromonas sp. L23]MCX2768009.1 hypothetical protein [Pseudoalteromonas sp. B530]
MIFHNLAKFVNALTAADHKTKAIFGVFSVGFLVAALGYLANSLYAFI